jgi:hypothetical protein
MMLFIFMRAVRAWEARNKLAGIFIRSPGKHTESVVLLDNAGSAYQIAVEASGLYFCPQVTITEYVPETNRLLRQKTLKSTIVSLRSDLRKALQLVQDWMHENKSTRLSQDEEMAVLRKMYERAGGKVQDLKSSASGSTAPCNYEGWSSDETSHY